MTKMPRAGERHRDAVLVGFRNGFAVFHRSAGLHDERHAKLRGGRHVVRERKKCIARQHHFADSPASFRVGEGRALAFQPIGHPGLREFLAELRVSVPVSRLAKWKTAVQLVAVGFLIAGEAGDRVLPYTTDIGLVLLWISAIVTLYTGWDYLQAASHHLIEE